MNITHHVIDVYLSTVGKQQTIDGNMAAEKYCSLYFCLQSIDIRKRKIIWLVTFLTHVVYFICKKDNNYVIYTLYIYIKYQSFKILVP